MNEIRAGEVIPASRVNELPRGAVVVIEWTSGWNASAEVGSPLLHCGGGDWVDADAADLHDGGVGGAHTGDDAVYHVLWVPGTELHAKGDRIALLEKRLAALRKLPADIAALYATEEPT